MWREGKQASAPAAAQRVTTASSGTAGQAVRDVELLGMHACTHHRWHLAQTAGAPLGRAARPRQCATWASYGREATGPRHCCWPPEAARALAPGTVYNVVDDDPAPRGQVVAYARQLLGAGSPAGAAPGEGAPQVAAPPPAQPAREPGARQEPGRAGRAAAVQAAAPAPGGDAQRAGNGAAERPSSRRARLRHTRCAEPAQRRRLPFSSLCLW